MKDCSGENVLRSCLDCQGSSGRFPRVSVVDKWHDIFTTYLENGKCRDSIIDSVNRTAEQAIEEGDYLSLLEAYLHFSHRLPIHDSRFINVQKECPWTMKIPLVTRHLLKRRFAMEKTKPDLNPEACFEPYVAQCIAMEEKPAAIAFQTICEAPKKPNSVFGQFFAFCDKRLEVPSILPGSLIMAVQMCATKMGLLPDYQWNKEQWEKLLAEINSDPNLSQTFLSYALRFSMFSSPERAEIFNFALDEIGKSGLLDKTQPIILAEFGGGPGSVIANTNISGKKISVDIQPPDLQQAIASCWPTRKKPGIIEELTKLQTQTSDISFVTADYTSPVFLEEIYGQLPPDRVFSDRKEPQVVVISSFSLCQNPWPSSDWPQAIQNMHNLIFSAESILWLDVGMGWPVDKVFPLRVFHFRRQDLHEFNVEVSNLGTIGQLGTDQMTIADRKVQLLPLSDCPKIWASKLHNEVILGNTGTRK